MELYTLDSTLRRAAVIDRFESVIWTERSSAFGDFELVISSTNDSRALLVAGTRLAINVSNAVMEVETIESKTDSEGRSMLKVTGRSLEAILTERVNRRNFSPSSPGIEKWVITDTPTGIIRQIFDSMCRNNTINTGDNIPFLTTGSLFPPSNVPEPSDIITVELPIGTVYDSIKQIADVYDLGFRMYRGPDDATLYFETYIGSDRTTLQSTLAPVVFSPSLDNLTDTSELTSVAIYKNVAYVFGLNGVEIVYAPGADASTAGFQRSVLMVDAKDIDLPAGAGLTAALKQRGAEELSKNKSLSAFDGEIPENSNYKYNQHYFLGDLVEMRSEDGITNQMRVTEQIFVSDANGEKSYPTLAIDLFITPGSWFAWDYNQVWADADGYWADA